MNSSPVNSTPQIISLNAILNHNGKFNSTNSIFSPTISGYYWFHVSTGLQDCCPSSINLVINNGSSASSTSLASDASSSGIEMSVDLIKWIEATDKVYLLPETLLLHNTSGKITFIGFYADNVVQSSVSLQLDLLYERKSNNIDIDIDKITRKRAIASNWTVSLFGEFVYLGAPETGVYILVAKIGMDEAWWRASNDGPNKMGHGIIKWTLTDGKRQAVNIAYHRNVTWGLFEPPLQRTLSLIYLVSLNSRDKIMLQFDRFSYEKFLVRVSVQLMLYKPKPSCGMMAVWAVKQLDNKKYFAQLNEGQTWDERNSAVKISIAGLYYVSLSAIIETTVAYKTNILLNNLQPVITLSANLTENVELDEQLFTSQQSALLNLMNDDELQVDNIEGSRLELYFVGFLIAPN